MNRLLWLLLAAGLAAGGCGSGDATATLSASWAVVSANAPDPNTAPPTTCDQVEVVTVRIDTGPGGLFDFACANYMGTSGSIPAGYYDVQVEALGQGGKLLTATEFRNTYAFGPTSLGSVRFQIP